LFVPGGIRFAAGGAVAAFFAKGAMGSNLKKRRSNSEISNRMRAAKDNTGKWRKIPKPKLAVKIVEANGETIANEELETRMQAAVGICRWQKFVEVEQVKKEVQLREAELDMTAMRAEQSAMEAEDLRTLSAEQAWFVGRCMETETARRQREDETRMLFEECREMQAQWQREKIELQKKCKDAENEKQKLTEELGKVRCAADRKVEREAKKPDQTSQLKKEVEQLKRKCERLDNTIEVVCEAHHSDLAEQEEQHQAKLKKQTLSNSEYEKRTRADFEKLQSEFDKQARELRELRRANQNCSCEFIDHEKSYIVWK